MQRCPNCGEENADRAKFCSGCATLLELGRPDEAGDHLRAAREIFADLGAIPLVEQTDDLLRIATAKTS